MIFYGMGQIAGSFATKSPLLDAYFFGGFFRVIEKSKKIDPENRSEAKTDRQGIEGTQTAQTRQGAGQAGSDAVRAGHARAL